MSFFPSVAVFSAVVFVVPEDQTFLSVKKNAFRFLTFLHILRTTLFNVLNLFRGKMHL